MALVVEDGTGKVDAQSYQSVAEFRAYWVEHGNPTDLAVLTDPQVETALVMGTQYLELVYGELYLGNRSNELQALGFPRYGIVDRDGYVIASNSIPKRMKHATNEAAARYSRDTAKGLIPDQSQDRELSRKAITAGPISIDKTWLSAQADAKRYTIIESLMGPLTEPEGTVIRS